MRRTLTALAILASASTLAMAAPGDKPSTTKVNDNASGCSAVANPVSPSKPCNNDNGNNGFGNGGRDGSPNGKQDETR